MPGAELPQLLKFEWRGGRPALVQIPFAAGSSLPQLAARHSGESRVGAVERSATGGLGVGVDREEFARSLGVAGIDREELVRSLGVAGGAAPPAAGASSGGGGLGGDAGAGRDGSARPRARGSGFGEPNAAPVTRATSPGALRPDAAGGDGGHLLDVVEDR
jgi:hypothetical protein